VLNLWRYGDGIMTGA